MLTTELPAVQIPLIHIVESDDLYLERQEDILWFNLVRNFPWRRYRQALPKREVAFMQAATGREMAEFGYTRDPIRFSFADHLVYALYDWPVNRFRMSSRLVRESLQHNHPARFGRKLSANRIVKDPVKQKIEVEPT